LLSRELDEPLDLGALIERHVTDPRTERDFQSESPVHLPGLDEPLERRDVAYAIRLPANQVLERTIEHVLTRPPAHPATPSWCGIEASRIRPRRGTGLDG
jgi:hypothetical protein